MSKRIDYNLPSHGFVSCNLFDNAVALTEMLTEYRLIEKMKKTYQLGTMKYIYPGAHHTRYEYVFTQLLLISNIADRKNDNERSIDVSIGSKLKEFGSICEITGADLMQCIAILSNAGHMYDTFTSSKIILEHLIESKRKCTDFYLKYRSNIPTDAHNSFDEMINTGNYYKLHLFNMMHLIKGMSRNKAYAKICDLSIAALIRLVDSTKVKYDATERILTLYRKTRKIAYLSVDMIYTPASFGINLNRIIYSFPSYLDDLFDEDSAINRVIMQLEDMVHRQIYNSPKSILNSVRIQQENAERYMAAIIEMNNIFNIRKLIAEADNGDFTIKSDSQPEAIKNLLVRSELLLSRDVSENDNPYEVVKTDKKILNEISESRIVFGSQRAQNIKRIYYAFGLCSSKHICRDVQSIIKNSIRYSLYSENEKIELVKYAVKSLYKYNEYYFTFSSGCGLNVNDMVFIGNGCKNIAHTIRRTFNDKTVKNPDRLHEILTCAAALEDISYSGMVLCFVGSVKASEYRKSNKIDELDGFIYFPNRNKNHVNAVIVEAKNYTKGTKDAVKQLNETTRLLTDSLAIEAKELTRGAYLSIMIND